MASIPETHRALILSSTNTPPEVKTIPTPQPGPGSVIVRMLLANVISYSRDIYNGARKYRFPTPLVIGTSGIGRIAARGPDTTAFTPGQLVLVDSFIKARDDPTSAFLMGVSEGPTEGSRILMRGEWKDATYAEYAKIPLENCALLDEKRLLGTKEEGGLGYKIEDLADLSRLAVPYGGLSDIGLKPGETVIVAPATGPFGSAAVKVALAMGARVIALGRNVEVLKRLVETNERVAMVQITGDVQADTETLKKFGPVDAYFDISPPAAATSTHLKSSILALEHSGRVSLMGGIHTDVAIPHSTIMHKDLTLKGKWMYNRENIKELIKMTEVGVLKLAGGANGQVTAEKFKLDDWEKAFDAAAESAASGGKALIVP